MAKVKSPLMSESAVGQIGGLLFRNNGYGNIVSRRSIAPSLRTPAQTITRSRLKLAHSAWTALSATTKNAWEEFATYPETGRNAFIGRWLRWQILALPGNPSPIHHTSYNKLENFVWTITGLDPPSIEAFYDYTGDGSSYLIYKTLATYSGRETPKPRKLIVSGTSSIDLPPYNFFPKVGAPIVHVKLEIVDNINASIIQSMLFRVELTWP